MTRNKRRNRLTAEPKAWWQSVIAGERLPNGASVPVNVKFRRRKCEGTVEDYRRAALDVRDLYRLSVFNQPVGVVWGNCAMRWPWLRSFRLDSASLELELRNGRIVTVPLSWTQSGIFYRYWLACPICHRTVCLLYGIDEQCSCQRCARLWHASRRKSAKGRNFLRLYKIRQRLGGMPTLSAQFPPRPRYMHRKTYDRLRATARSLEARIFR